ncbi:4'-phosphopantetheinyl transferase family protein [Streptomyces tendae]|uniref:4'-phosphopantetheinyl transferase family protein n=1 Tax=Streptomyces tendae TaxID=1932 RepID=UPI0037F49B30
MPGHSDRPVRPVHVPGPDGPWAPLRESLRRHSLAVVYGWAPRWSPPREQERRPASRTFFRRVVAEALGVPPRSVDIAYMPHGRPFVRGCADLEVGLSHSGPLLVAAVSRCGRVGVDAEAADRTPDDGWEEMVCTPQERGRLTGLAPGTRAAELIRMWTLKEAYSKAMGQGMRYPFDRIGFALPGPPQRSLGPDGDWHPVTGWHCATRTVRGGDRPYLVSWVHRCPDRPDTPSAGWPAEEVLPVLLPEAVRRPVPWTAP